MKKKENYHLLSGAMESCQQQLCKVSCKMISFSKFGFKCMKDIVSFQWPLRVVRCGKDVVYLASLGRPTDIVVQLGKACCPCST